MAPHTCRSCFLLGCIFCCRGKRLSSDAAVLANAKTRPHKGAEPRQFLITKLAFGVHLLHFVFLAIDNICKTLSACAVSQPGRFKVLIFLPRRMRTWNGRVLPVGWTWCWICGWPVRASHFRRREEVPEQDHIGVSNAAYVHRNALPSVDDIKKDGLHSFIPGWNGPPMPPQPQSQARKAMKKPAASIDDRKPKLSVLKKKPAASGMHVRACADETSSLRRKNKK